MRVPGDGQPAVAAPDTGDRLLREQVRSAGGQAHFGYRQRRGPTGQAPFEICRRRPRGSLAAIYRRKCCRAAPAEEFGAAARGGRPGPAAVRRQQFRLPHLRLRARASARRPIGAGRDGPGDGSRRRLLLLATEDSFSGAFTSRLWCCRTYNRHDLFRTCRDLGLEWSKELWFTRMHKLLRAGGICVEIRKAPQPVPADGPGSPELIGL